MTLTLFPQIEFCIENGRITGKRRELGCSKRPKDLAKDPSRGLAAIIIPNLLESYLKRKLKNA
jgi:hypothetical protein